MKSNLLLIVLGLFLWGHDAFAQRIEIMRLPQWGMQGYLEGKVAGVNPADYRVLVYLYFEGYWWVKPYNSEPLTLIMPDSAWSCYVTTGGCDTFAPRYAAFLVPAGFLPDSNRYTNQLPGSLYQHPFDYRCRIPGSRTLAFSGMNWKVKGLSNGCPSGPSKSWAYGNLWNDADSAVFVDEAGHLHLQIVYDDLIHRWKCSEVIADTSLGYGNYQFTVRNRLDNLDPNVVFSPFVYDEYGDTCYYREIDMEASRWEVETDPNFQYVVQPWNIPGNRHRFYLTSDTGTCHRFLWKKDTVIFESRKGDGTLIHGWDYTAPYVPEPYQENVRINLWLFSNNNVPANPGNKIEVVVEKFEFENLLPAPVDLNASKGAFPGHVQICWSPVPKAGYYMVYRSPDNDPTTAVQLGAAWLSATEWNDPAVVPGSHYYYWVRASDNSSGSNTFGYSSGFSHSDSGWAAITNYLQDVLITTGMDTCFDAIQNMVVAGNGTFFMIRNGGTVRLVAGQSIRLLPGVTASQGCYFLASVSENPHCPDPIDDDAKLTLSDRFLADSAMTWPQVNVYPNPTAGIITLQYSGKITTGYATTELWSVFGQKIATQNWSVSEHPTISLEGYASGIYFLRIVFQGNIGVYRIIKQ